MEVFLNAVKKTVDVYVMFFFFTSYYLVPNVNSN